MTQIARRPWSPVPLVLVALVGGLPGAGILLGINWYRLGRPDLGRNVLVLAAFVTVAGAGLLAWLHATGRVTGIAGPSSGTGGGAVMGGQARSPEEYVFYVAQVGIALLIALPQRRAFERYLAESSPTEGIGTAFAESIVSMIAGAVAGIIVHQAIVRLAVRVFSGG